MTSFRKNWQMLNFMKIHSELLKLLHEYWWTGLNRHSSYVNTSKNGFSGKEREALIQSHERMKVQLHVLYTSVLMQGGQLLKTEPAARYD